MADARQPLPNPLGKVVSLLKQEDHHESVEVPLHSTVSEAHATRGHTTPTAGDRATSPQHGHSHSHNHQRSPVARRTNGKNEHSHVHGHGHSHGRRRKHTHHADREDSACCTKASKYWFVALITGIYCIVEITFALKLHSLSLLSDGFHNLGDMLAIFIALYCEQAKGRRPTSTHTYGWARISVLGGLANGWSLIALSLYISLSAIPRFLQPRLDEGQFEGRSFMLIAAVGLLVNVVGTLLFCATGSHGHSHGGHEDHDHDANMKAVFLHFLGDSLSSFCVLVTGFLLEHHQGQTWLPYVDPAASLLIVAVILATTIPMVGDLSQYVMQAVPRHVSLVNVRRELVTIPGVVSVHELHMWRLSPTVTVASVHVVTAELDVSNSSPRSSSPYPFHSRAADGSVASAVRAHVGDVFHSYGVHSTTVQIEKDSDQQGNWVCSQHCAPRCEATWCCDPS